MTIIRRQEVPYLNKEVLELYNNVTIVSTEGVFIKMNVLILCASSQSLKNGFHEEDDEHTIITEFSLEELKQVKDFCLRGSCDVIAESILKAFGLLTITKINLENIKDEKNDHQAEDKLDFQSAIDTLLENSLMKDENNIDIKHWSVLGTHIFHVRFRDYSPHYCDTYVYHYVYICNVQRSADTSFSVLME